MNKKNNDENLITKTFDYEKMLTRVDDYEMECVKMIRDLKLKCQVVQFGKLLKEVTNSYLKVKDTILEEIDSEGLSEENIEVLRGVVSDMEYTTTLYDLKSKRECPYCKNNLIDDELIDFIRTTDFVHDDYKEGSDLFNDEDNDEDYDPE